MRGVDAARVTAARPAAARAARDRAAGRRRRRRARAGSRRCRRGRRPSAFAARGAAEGSPRARRRARRSAAALAFATVPGARRRAPPCGASLRASGASRHASGAADPHQRLAGADRGALGNQHLGHDAAVPRGQLVLHLHRFDHHHRLARRDRVAGLARGSRRPDPGIGACDGLAGRRAADARTRLQHLLERMAHLDRERRRRASVTSSALAARA